ncbi:MAG: hypothetical protein KGM42_00655 [Hyphomicrobiales bacterium]|nr:hypothetical protein [Hyphomicrobiales bacterium]
MRRKPDKSRETGVCVKMRAPRGLLAGLALLTPAFFLFALLAAISVAQAAGDGARAGTLSSISVGTTAGASPNSAQHECANNGHASMQQNCFSCIVAPFVLPVSVIVEAGNGRPVPLSSRQREMFDQIEPPDRRPPKSFV